MIDVSMNIVILIILIVIIVGFYLKNKNKIINIEELSTQEEKDDINRWVVEEAIKKNDKEKLKRLLDNPNINNNSDLSKLIRDYLK